MARLSRRREPIPVRVPRTTPLFARTPARARGEVDRGDRSAPDRGDRSAPGHALIALDRVWKVFELGQIRVQALRDVTLRVDAGDMVAIMGSSGSGKSTLMNILGCLDLPTSGRYLIGGVDVRDMDEDELADLRNHKIGFVFKSFNLVARTSALANVELPLAYAGLRGGERRRRAERALRSVGMEGRMHHQPSELSGGEQQRVAIARALVTNPSLILADEPTGNLDSRATAEVLGILARLNEERRTVVLITHEPDVAEQTKRVVRLSDGAIVGDERTLPVEAPPPLPRAQKSAHHERQPAVEAQP